MLDWRPDPPEARFRNGLTTVHYYVAMGRKP